MARTKWSIRNYNAFIREARRLEDLTLDEARRLYREMRNHPDIGHALYAVDLHRYEDIRKELAEKIRKERDKPITSVEEWLELWEDQWEYLEPEEYEGTATYE